MFVAALLMLAVQDGEKGLPLPPLNIPKTMPALPERIPPDPNAGRVATPPQPANDPGTWVTADDYPASAIRKEEEGTVAVVLEIGIDGMVQRCFVSASSGSPALDQAACTLLTRRARFSPGLDAMKRPLVSRKQMRFRWQLPEPEPELDQPWSAEILFTIDAEGRLATCEEQSSREDMKGGCAGLSGASPEDIAALRGTANGRVRFWVQMSQIWRDKAFDLPSPPDGMKVVFAGRRSSTVGPDGKPHDCVASLDGKETAAECDGEKVYPPGAERFSVEAMEVRTDGDPDVRDAFVRLIELLGE